MKRTHAMALALLAALAGAGINQATQPIQPRLIAQGCLGAGGDIWAMDESDFPTDCDNIERWER